MSRTYKSRRVLKKSLDGYSKVTQRKNDQIKHEVNNLISRTTNSNSRTLMLDSGSGNTSKYLFDHGVRPENNIVPNYNECDCESLRKLGYSTPLNCSLSDCLNILSNESITHTWFDYCGRWNETMKSDIAILFGKHILTFDGEFSITFGFRGLKLENIAALKDYADIVKTFIMNIAEENGYKIVPMTSFFYGTVTVKGQRGRPKKMMVKIPRPTGASMMFQMYKCVLKHDEDLYW